METTGTQPTTDKTQWSVFAAIAAAVTASICCIGPLLLFALGITGAWMGNLRALEPYRPIFMAVAVAFLGFGFYRVYRKPKAEACEDGSYCANPKSGRINRISLWVAAFLIGGMFAYPNVAAYLASAGNAPSDNTSSTTEAVLEVKGMTCGGCVAAVTRSLKGLAGVNVAQVTLKPPRAVVEYDADKVGVEELTKAVTDVGFSATVQAEGVAEEFQE